MENIYLDAFGRRKTAFCGGCKVVLHMRAVKPRHPPGIAHRVIFRDVGRQLIREWHVWGAR